MEIKVNTIGHRDSETALHEVTITDHAGFSFRELFTNAEADELVRKLIISRHGSQYGSGDYTGTFCNGYVRMIDGTPEEEEQKKREEAATDAFFAQMRKAEREEKTNRRKEMRKEMRDSIAAIRS